MTVERINYLMSGPAHMPYLVVSLHTLRQHWKGEVWVHAYPESWPFVSKVCDDKNLDITACVFNPSYRGKNNQFINKIQMMMDSECDSALYLDGDTMIGGSLDELFTRAKYFGFVATQFNAWTTNHVLVQERIKRLYNYPLEIPKQIVDQALIKPLPSVNGGVFACLPGSEVLPLWHKMAMAAREIFICDETVLHVLQVKFPKHQFDIAKGGRYNCSPIIRYRAPGLTWDKVVVWHFHGDSCVRENKSLEGVNLWWPVYQDCLQQNVGNINDWIGEVDNRHLRELLKSKTQKAAAGDC